MQHHTMITRTKRLFQTSLVVSARYGHIKGFRALNALSCRRTLQSRCALGWTCNIRCKIKIVSRCQARQQQQNFPLVFNMMCFFFSFFFFFRFPFFAFLLFVFSPSFSNCNSSWPLPSFSSSSASASSSSSSSSDSSSSSSMSALAAKVADDRREDRRRPVERRC